MFLKSLEVLGFKSFADRTRIEFSDGITALLGPNGCGKSNVVDAVKWVLGEKTAKNMRAGKMEDVIFNGTETRKPLNVAEVMLTIENENGLLPLDTSEITIKRRLYRSGESEYFINNQQVKLKDVQELFWDTGVGKAAYSVMEQGKIDQILSSKPEDRRYLFEEAAGITRFKAKCAEAERNLERTEENMKQVESVMGEVKRSYDTLKVQADKTLKYRQLKDDIFNNELDIQLLRLKGFTSDRRNKEQDVKIVTENRSETQAKMDEINKALSSNMDEVNAMESELVEKQQKIYGLAIEEKAKSQQATMLEERRIEAKNKVQQLEGKKKGVEERIELLKEDTDEQESAIHESNRRLGEIEKNIVSFEENITLASTQITENDRIGKNLENEIEELNSVRGNLAKELEGITENIVTELDSKLKEAGYSIQSGKKAKENVDYVVAQLKILTEGRKKLFMDFAAIQGPSENDVKKFANNALSSFADIEKLISQLENFITEYAKASPTFIDEFLSPEGIITKKRAIDQKIQENRLQVATKREKITQLKVTNLDLVDKINEYRTTLEGMRINKVQMQSQIKAAEDQLRLLRRELSSQENALREIENDIFTEQKRFEEIDDQVVELEGEIASIQRQGLNLTKELEELETDIASRNNDVSSKREDLKKFTGEIAKYQQQLEKLHLDLATSETEIRNIKDNFRETHSRDLMEFEERMFTITTPASELREKLSESRQSIKNLGSVNLMAVEEFAETKERYDFLSNQIADLQKARDDLFRITEEIKAESTELFLATYNKIKKNFHNMFRRMFGGGRAELRLVDPGNVLESGIDIFAQPPGKKLENIALLSGGEKTMTAVALLFATYMVRPSPFCLLDEIDAALDEQNVLRFVQTLREFGNVSQYIVITHNKKTVAAASTMLGVTMEESGVSKVITIRLEEGAGLYIPDPEPFEEEEVPPEENVVIPPHPPKRIRKNNLVVVTSEVTLPKNAEPFDEEERVDTETKSLFAEEGNE